MLWVPDAEAKGIWAAAQIRPTTGPTTLLEDVVGTFVPAQAPPDARGRASGERPSRRREGDPEWRDDVPVRVETCRSA